MIEMTALFAFDHRLILLFFVGYLFVCSRLPLPQYNARDCDSVLARHVLRGRSGRLHGLSARFFLSVHHFQYISGVRRFILVGRTEVCIACAITFRLA